MVSDNIQEGFSNKHVEDTHNLGDVERVEPYEMCSVAYLLPSEPGNDPCPILFSDLNIT